MKKIAVLILIFVSASVQASEYGGVPLKFFDLIISNKSVKAIDYLYSTNKWVDANSDTVINLKTQLEGIEKLVGKYKFHELISENKVGTRYAHLIYLVGYERQPLRFEIRVYKPDDEWHFQGFSFDAELTDDIEKEVNLDLIK